MLIKKLEIYLNNQCRLFFSNGQSVEILYDSACVLLLNSISQEYIYTGDKAIGMIYNFK